MYDYVVVGAGPSGAVLSRLLGEENKYQILLLDRRELAKEESKFKKSCGGLLSPAAQQELAKIEISIPNEILESPQLFAVDTIDVDNNLSCLYQRNYYNMNREKFDRFLVGQIPENVDRVFGCEYKCSKKITSGYELTYTKDGREFKVQTKNIVGADGGNSKVRREFFSNKPSPKEYISIQKWYKVNYKHKYYVGIFDRKQTDFYSWSIPKGEYLVLGAAFKKGESAHQKFALLKDTYQDYYDLMLGDSFKQDGAIIKRCTRLNQLCFGSKHVFLIGEASGAISPTSAEGFSYAIKTARYLKKAIESKKDTVFEYQRNCLKIKLSILFKLIKYPGMYNKFVRKIVMKTKIGSIK